MGPLEGARRNSWPARRAVTLHSVAIPNSRRSATAPAAPGSSREHKSHCDLPEKAQAQAQGLCLTMRYPDGEGQSGFGCWREHCRPPPVLPLAGGGTQTAAALLEGPFSPLQRGSWRGIAMAWPSPRPRRGGGELPPKSPPPASPCRPGGPALFRARPLWRAWPPARPRRRRTGPGRPSGNRRR